MRATVPLSLAAHTAPAPIATPNVVPPTSYVRATASWLGSTRTIPPPSSSASQTEPSPVAMSA